VETDQGDFFAPEPGDGGVDSDGADTGLPGDSGDGDGDGGDGDGDGDGGDGDGDIPDTCGNGAVDVGEECDDGEESASCNKDCTTAICGDGKLNVTAGEDCEGEVAYDNVSCLECAFECDSTYGDCNDNLDADGCETWLAVEDNCGTCGNTCDQGLLCADGACAITNTHGNDQEFNEGNTSTANYLLGNSVYLPAGKVTHLSLIAKQGGQKVKLALYADQGGNPGALVAQTPETDVQVGNLEISVGDAVDVAAGDYWLLAVYDQDASVGIDTSDPNEPVKYISLNFANPLPDPLPGAQSYNGQTLNYYVNMVP
jgi:hypothetical protein